MKISDTNTKNTVAQDDEQYQKKNQETWSFKVKRRGLSRLGNVRLSEATPARRPLTAFLRPCKCLSGRSNYLKHPLANINSANKSSVRAPDTNGYLEHLRTDRKRWRGIVRNMAVKKNKNENNCDQSKRMLIKSYTC